MIFFAKFVSTIRQGVRRLFNDNGTIGLGNTKRLISHRSPKGPFQRLATTIALTGLLLLTGTCIANAALPSLKVSNDGRFIIQQDGTPLFWLADDAWGLHNRLSLSDAKRFLDTRKSQGFTVIHTWLASTWMLQNRNGDEPFQGALNNTNAIRLNEAFFEHVGKVIDLAEARELYLVLEIGQVLRSNVPKWWIGGFGSHQEHVEKAYEYGWRVAQVLKKKGKPRSNLIWGLGQDTHPERGKRVGDKNAANSARNFKKLVQSMAEGLADATNGLAIGSHDGRADYSTTMMSFHVGATGPTGGPSGDPSSSSEWFHKDSWLDYNAHQSGRHDRYIAAVHKLMSADYNRSPTKPALETEVSYENQVIEGESGRQRYTAYHSRLHAYWAVFAGGAGHQYGNNNVWQFYDPSRFTPRGEATTHWATAIKSAGAKQMGHLRNLIESRPFLNRIPDQHLLKNAQESSGHTRLQATRAGNGSYAFVYSTNGRDFDVNLDPLSGQIANAWWYDPRTGKAIYSGQLGASGVHNFDPPGSPSSSKASEGNDWVLVLDDASQNFPAPGTKLPVIIDPTNQPPVTTAGSDQTISAPAIVSLQGKVSDDGLPSGTLSTQWSVVSGPGEVTFTDATAAKTTVSFADQGQYVLRLRASDGELSDSDKVTITVDDESDTSFGTPTNLRAVQISSDQIDLQWDDVTGETSYLLIGRSGGTRVLRIRLGANTTGFSHFKLAPESVYKYKVQADRSSDEGGSSAWSDWLYVTTTKLPPPPVTNQPPVATAGSDQSISAPAIVSLEGKVSDDGLPSDTLDIEWSVVSGPGEVTFADPAVAKTTASFTDQGQYVLRLSASDGELSGSDEVTITVEDASDIPFGAPANLKAMQVSGNQIDLRWDDVTGEASYLLIARSGGAEVLKIRLDANTNAFSHFKLSPDTLYRYKVRADRPTDEGGNSAWSDRLYVTTTEGTVKPPPPPVDDAEIAFIISHRGGRAEAPENTLAAFERALDLGVNIEMDVRLSSDGVIVVIHDDTVDRTTNKRGRVASMSLRSLKELDAGSHFDRRYKGERIPTLDEVFNLFIAQAPANAIMSIDTKVENASMYDGIIALLKRYNLFERTFIQVTDTRVGDALRQRDNRVQLAVWAPSNREIDAAIDYPHYQRIDTRSRYARRVKDAHNADKTLIAFVNSDEDIGTVKDFDVDGINTDRPKQMLSKFDD